LDEVVQKLNPLRTPGIYLKQFQHVYPKLPKEKRELIDRYGVFFCTPETFNPHITLAYKRQSCLSHLHQIL